MRDSYEAKRMQPSRGPTSFAPVDYVRYPVSPGFPLYKSRSQPLSGRDDGSKVTLPPAAIRSSFAIGVR